MGLRNGRGCVQDGGKTLSRIGQNFKRLLPGNRSAAGNAEDADVQDQPPQDGRAPQSRGLSRLKARFLKKDKDAAADVPPSSFDYASSMGFPQVPCRLLCLWPSARACMYHALAKGTCYGFVLLTGL